MCLFGLCVFKCNQINFSDVKPSVLTNSGLLIAGLVVDGEEVAAVNIVNIFIFILLFIIL